MFKTSILVLAAVASAGVTLVTSTSSADARPGLHGGFGGGFHRPHFQPHFRPHFHPHRHVRWHRPWVYGVGAAVAAPVLAAPVLAAPAYAAAAPKPGPCTCLIKEYTPDNLVVFKDLCTKEVASAPAGNTQALLPAPQAEAAPTTQQ